MLREFGPTLMIGGLVLSLLSVVLSLAALLPFVGDLVVIPALVVAGIASLDAGVLVWMVRSREPNEGAAGPIAVSLVAVGAAIGLALSLLALAAHASPSYDHWSFG